MDSVFALPRGSAVVTGGAGAVGAAIAAALAASDVPVATLDVAPRSPAGELHIACDASDATAVGTAVRAIEERLGPIAMLVCAAGVVSQHPLEELAIDEWRRVLDASLIAAYVPSRAIVPGMAARGAGAVVTVSSGLATRGLAMGGHYAAAKAGVEAFTKSLALEYASAGVRANAVAPGPLRTKLLRSMRAFDEHERSAAIPLGRLGEPRDVVGPVLFLLSDAGRYVTGAVLHVNGGLTIV